MEYTPASNTFQEHFLLPKFLHTIELIDACFSHTAPVGQDCILRPICNRPSVNKEPARSFDNSITTSFFSFPTLLMHVEEKMDFRSRWSDTARRAAIRPRTTAIESTRDQGTHSTGKPHTAKPRRFHPAQILHGLPFERDAVALVQPCGPAFLGRSQRRRPRPEDTQFFRVDPSSRPPSWHRARLSQRHVLRRQRRTYATSQVPHAPSIRSAQPCRPRCDLRLDSRSSAAKNGISTMNVGEEMSFHDFFTHREHSSAALGITIVCVRPPTCESRKGSHPMTPWVTCDACLTGAGIARISQPPIRSITITASHLNAAI